MTLIHQALVFDSAPQFLAAAVPFIAEGVHRGDTVVAATSAEHTKLLREQLDGASDHVVFLEPLGWFDSPGRTLDAHHRHLDALAAGDTVLRVLGEPVWADRDEIETSEWGRFESVMNVALADSRAWVMCGYDSRTVSTAIIDDARRTHPSLVIGAASEISTSYADPASYYADRNTPLPPPPTDAVEWVPIYRDLAPVRQFVAERSTRLGLPPERLDDFILAVNEVATNAVLHGAGHGTARIWATDRRITCEISDPGRATANFMGFMRADPLADNGHGLWIARQICDLLEVRAGAPGTTVRLHMRR